MLARRYAKTRQWGVLFWQAKGANRSKDAAKSVVEQARRDDTICEPRRQRSLDYASLVEGLELSSFGVCGYAVSADRDQACFRGTKTPIIRNTAYAAWDAFVSAIAAEDPPLPAMLTQEGSWKDRRQAEALERLVEAEFRSPKGAYATLHELWIQGFRVAAGATGAVLVRYYNDAGKVGAKIHDSLDSSMGPDRTWCILRTWYDVDDAIDLFPDREDDIRRAKSNPPLEFCQPQAVGFNAPDMVCIYEGWRVSRGGKPGTYVAALDLSDVDALTLEDYPHERLPVVPLVIIPHLKGPWGHSITHHVYESVYRCNWMLQSIDRSVSKTNKQTTYVNKMALADPSALDKSEDNLIIETTTDPREAAYVVNAPGFNPAHLDLANMHSSDAHDISGVSELHTEGKRELGLPSAEAQRFVADLINKRFAAVQQRYIQAVAVDSAYCIIQVLCDIFQDDRKLTRTWPDQESIREISAAVALKGIGTLKYLVRPAAVAGSHNSPADRQQAAFELFKSGTLSQDAYASLQQRGYDLPKELAARSVTGEWLERQMYEWQFASDADVKRPDFYEPPIAHIDVPLATLQTIDGFLEARMAKLEDNRLEFYLMMMADLSTLLASNQSAPNQNPQLAPAAPQQAAAVAA